MSDIKTEIEELTNIVAKLKRRIIEMIAISGNRHASATLYAALSDPEED